MALRAGDLAYLHVHPADDGARPGPEVAFAATAPSAGDYRLFLDFRHGDAVHTAAFSVRAGQDGAVAPAPAGPEPAGHGHGG